MSDYKRLFSYLYFYQHKIKEKNSGFVKVEIRNNQCRLQLSVKGGFLNQAPQWNVYGFMREDYKLRLWRLGRINAGNGQGEWGVQMPLVRFLGEAADLNHVAGLLLYGGQDQEGQEPLPDMEDGGKGLICATVWDDLPLFMPGEASMEVLHAAQVDEPEEQGWAKQPQPERAEDVLTGEGSLPSTDREWVRKKKEGQQEEKREEQSEAGELLQAEGTEAMDSTVEEWDTLRELLEEKEVERIMADRAVLQESSEHAKREPESEQQMPKLEPSFFGPPRPSFIQTEPCQEEEKNLRQEQPETKQEQSGCPCPEQCIWSDMYQEPPKSLWEKLASFYPKLILNGMGSDWEILKIMPRDIGRLPRENWVYGNNSFLLHGYYRHHHLILACYKGTTPCQYYLGVPGACSERERVMASMFGFTNYLPGGKRGYWYTPVNLGNN